MSDHPEAIFTISFPDPAIANHVHNKRFVSHDVPPPKKKARVIRDTTPLVGDTVLTIRPDQFSSAQGIYFGSDTKQCDIFLGPQASGVSALHFRVTCKFQQKRPKDFIVRNVSSGGTIVDKKQLVRSSATGGFRKDIKHTILAGPVVLYLTYHPDKMTAGSWQRLQRMDIDPPNFNTFRLGAATQRTPLVKFDPQPVLTAIARYEDAVNVADLLPWKSGTEYKFLGEIARTERSSIHRLCRVSDSRVFAVKMTINGPHQTGRWTTKERLDAELQLSEELKHPNIIEFADSCQWPGSLLLVMDLASSGSMENYLASVSGIVENGTARTIMAHVWRGLSYLHSKDISHGDLTPANLLLLDLDPLCCVISDFGEARRGEFQTSVGTLGYMAPEVVRNLNNGDGFQYMSKPADIWSSGIIAYRLLTSLLPPTPPPAKLFNFRSTLVHWEPKFDKIDPRCQSLIQCLLSVDPSTRPTAEQCLDHEWHIDFPSFASTVLLSPPGDGYGQNVEAAARSPHPSYARPSLPVTHQSRRLEEDAAVPIGGDCASCEPDYDDQCHPDFSLMPGPSNCSMATTMDPEEYERGNDSEV